MDGCQCPKDSFVKKRIIIVVYFSEEVDRSLKCKHAYGKNVNDQLSLFLPQVYRVSVGRYPPTCSSDHQEEFC